MSPRLSKSRFTAGTQCPKLLWWKVHEPGAEELEPGPELAARFEWGRRVGEAAQGFVPGGVLIERDHDRLGDAVARTRDALDAGGELLYEASFSVDRVFVAVDILQRRSEGWVVTEVKSSTRVKDAHLVDAAIQAWVVRRAGLDVARIEVMHLNPNCRHPDLSNLFVRSDVTAEVRARQPALGDQVRALLGVLEGPRPKVAVGPHCDDPYPCPFKGRCWPELPDDHVSTLYRGGARVAALEAAGCQRLADVPPDAALTPIHRRQIRAVAEGQAIVEGDLRGALDGFEKPFAYLDFETVAPAIPLWPGCRPNEPVPVQFTCYAPGPSGRLRLHEWMAEGGEDPRVELGARLVEACARARTVFAYGAGFERRCILHLAEALPALRRPLEAIAHSLADLLPAVRNHVYHAAFRGRFGLKSVLPPLVPELDYADLEVAGGRLASAQLERMLILQPAMRPRERQRLRAALRRYCRQDAQGLVRLHRWLRAHA